MSDVEELSKWQLLKIGVQNAAWLGWRTWIEFCRYGHKRWWWQVRCALWWSWLDSSPKTLVDEAEARVTSPIDLIYGETLPDTAYRLLKRLDVGEGDRIVDLGCGRGVVPLVAARALGAKGYGIDLLPGYIERGKRIIRVLNLEGKLTFEQGDLLQCTIPYGTVYFFAGTCLSEQTWKLVVKRLTDAARAGAMAYSLSRRLPQTHWELLGEEQQPFTWGMATVYLHRRLDTKRLRSKAEE